MKKYNKAIIVFIFPIISLWVISILLKLPISIRAAIFVFFLLFTKVIVYKILK